MTWQPSLYAFVLILTAVVAAAVAFYAWRLRTGAATAAAVALLGAAEWSLGYGIALGVHELEARIFWAKIQHLGIAVIPLALLAFVLHYTGRERWLTRRNLLLLSVVPLLGVALAWTNEAHRLIWADIRLAVVGSTALLDIDYGPFFWFYTAYNYLIFALSALLVARTWLGAAPLRRRQTVVILLGILFPWGANLVYLAGWSPERPLDLTPFGYAVTGLAIAWGLYRYRLLDILPVAHDKLFEELCDAVLVIDSHGRVLDANPAASGLLGRPAAAVVGQPSDRVLPGPLVPTEDWSVSGPSATEVTLPDESDCRVFDLRLRPLSDRHGRPGGWLMVLHDVTDRVRAVEALGRYAAELQTSNSELDAYAHLVAHDLKGPLGVIQGHAELISGNQGRLSPAALEDSLQQIGLTTAKMASLVDDLLLLATVRRADEVPMGRLDMGAIVAEALGRLEDQRRARAVAVAVPDEWPPTVGYAPWVEQVWVNCLSNALRHAGRVKEGVAPSVELGFDRAADSIRLWVRDNGPGLTPEQQSQLFAGLGGPRSVRAQGHGLGLSIVRRIVERLGGQVGVESTPGQGSTFFFTLPIADRAAARALPEAQQR